ncbi:YjbE family putative metal transport protein [Rhizosaccharibacter radicis]|uniref:YjbE family putative metal transport protein n=1 Tax=Rhizosaccharibacter radicis TaxID=2782605 RepID=A0ABT1VXU7_9PROT|nr:YjbE family putative metal transport protein [Acetobacteraceae bacterium KSS12]
MSTGSILPHHLLPQLLDLLQVLLIDITLAGDNAVVVGLAVIGLPRREKRVAIIFGIAAAALIRIALATVALQLLAIIGLTLAGGLLLLWVCWRMYRELRGHQAATIGGAGADGEVRQAPPGALRRAIFRIVLADLSMSLDNVLAVAGAAGQHLWVLVTGLAMSVLLMGAAASLVARLLERFRWIGWIGLLIVLAVAIELIFKGSHQVLHHAGLVGTPRH